MGSIKRFQERFCQKWPELALKMGTAECVLPSDMNRLLPPFRPAPLSHHLATSDEDLPANLKPKPHCGDGDASSAFPEPASFLWRLSRLTRLFRFKPKKKSEASPSTSLESLRSTRRRPCRLTFIFDPAGRFCYYWSLIVSLAFVYNLCSVSYRFAFDEIRTETLVFWFTMDYTADLIYVLDLLMSFRTGFLKEGVLQTNTVRIRNYYTNTKYFYLDCMSLLPFEFLYLSLGFVSLVRCIRLAKFYKYWLFVDCMERHTDNPNACRAFILAHRLFFICHWNACLLYYFSDVLLIPSDFWDGNDRFFNYMAATSLSCQLFFGLNPLGFATVHSNQTSFPFIDRRLGTKGLLFLLAEHVFGLFLLAAIIGNVANMVAHRGFPRKQFQVQLESVKRYMRLRGVPEALQMKVIRWFEYLWSSKKSGREDQVLHCLPNRLKAEVAIQVHLDTLKKVEIFRNTEPGFLCELVLRLKPSLFSPGDFVCRKGEVGKEMYIVNRGKLQVLNDDRRAPRTLATLTAGSYFGEISLLNLGTEGNRRTASVISVGYSDLFCLSRRDIAEVLEDYPAARERLEQIAHRRLNQKSAMNKIAAPNCDWKTCSVCRTRSRRRFSAPASFVNKVNQQNNAVRTPAQEIPTAVHAPVLLPFVQTTTESYI